MKRPNGVLSLSLLSAALVCMATPGGSAPLAKAVALPYQLGHATFTSELWVHNGDLLDNPQFVEVDMESAGAFKLEVYDAQDKLIQSYSRENPHGGWSTFKFSAEAPVPAGDHKLKFVNASAGEKVIKSGRVDIHE